MKTTKRLISAALAIASVGSVSFAQSYYEDDIYFNPSKDKDKNIEQAKQAAKRQNEANGMILHPVTLADFPAADTYTDITSSRRDIDEYNRRGIFAQSTANTSDTTIVADFENTRKIERYYNPTIVIGSTDNELSQLYYAEPANVNIYVNSPGYWGWGYPYYSSYWGWNSLLWRSWYDPWYWGPSWSWGWGGPSWNWGWNWAWGPSWSWGWGGPHWGHGPSIGWTGGGRPPYDYNRHPGAGRQPAYGTTGTTRPGNYNGRQTMSGGNYGRPSVSGNSSSGRPAVSTGSNNSYRPGNVSNSNQQNNSYTRPGRNNSGSNNNSTYRSNSSSSSGSRGGFSGGSTGGSRSSGGAGGRGRH